MTPPDRPKQAPSIYRQWLESCKQMGIPAISTDMAARLMAVLYEYGNNEGLTLSQKFLEIKTARSTCIRLNLIEAKPTMKVVGIQTEIRSLWKIPCSCQYPGSPTLLR